MKKKIWIGLLVVLLLSGCSHNRKMAQAYTYSYDDDITIDNSGFPVTVSIFLDQLREYDFYDKLNIVQINWDQISSLKNQEYTLYILTEPQPEMADEGMPVLQIYSFDQLSIIYMGSDKQIHQALRDNSR